MTTAEKLDKLREVMQKIRQVERRNGASLPANAGPALLAARMFDFDARNVRTLWDDINTIDAIKNVVYNKGYWRQNRAGVVAAPEPLDLTAEELMEYESDDPRLTEGLHSWAVVRITKAGTEIVTYGGNYYQRYAQVTAADGTTSLTRKDIVDLRGELLKLDAAWLGVEHWECESRNHPTYTEGGVVYYCVPCDLPTDPAQLLACHLYTGDVQSDFDLSEVTAEEGMIHLPEGMYYIYDNSALESAPVGLMVPVELAQERIQIDYSPVADPLSRLRLVGDSFGDEYIISVIDGNSKMEGTWNE